MQAERERERRLCVLVCVCMYVWAFSFSVQCTRVRLPACVFRVGEGCVSTPRWSAGVSAMDQAREKEKELGDAESRGGKTRDPFQGTRGENVSIYLFFFVYGAVVM